MSRKVLILINFSLILIKLEVCSEKKIYDLKKVSKLFSNFVRKFDKKYISDKIEYKRRLKIFTQNIKAINRRNEETDGVEYRISAFSDMTEWELKNKFSLHFKTSSLCKPAPRSKRKITEMVPVAEEFDWRYFNVVTPVVQQGDCSSCWAITAVEAVETLHAVHYNKLIQLSPQQLIDCTDENNTCAGGLPCDGLNKLASRGVGIVAESSYPYTAFKGDCQVEGLEIVAMVGEAITHHPKDEEELKALVFNRGPIIVGIVAECPIYSYHSGIATASSLGCTPGHEISHAVLIVGYGIENGVPYWIIKNSYGDTWGENGYLRLERGTNACKILSYVVEAVIL